MDTQTIVIVSVFGAAWLVLAAVAVALCVRVARLRRALQEMQATGRIRVQKLKMKEDSNHAFQNPALVPDEELARRGYSMYAPSDRDLESARPVDRQTGGQFVEELTRELDHRQRRAASPPHPRGPDTTSFQNSSDRRNYDPEPRDARRGYSEPPRDFSEPRRDYTEPPRDYSESRRDFDPRLDNNKSTAPPFLLQAIEENKKKSRLANPVANGVRQSDTNPNFIY